MKVVSMVLTGCQDSRLHPLTAVRSKPAVRARYILSDSGVVVLPKGADVPDIRRCKI